MRINIRECLDEYNATHSESMTMRSLALKIYSDKLTNDQTKYTRLSQLNTGGKTATVKELVDICVTLECDCSELISDYEL